MDTSLPKSLVGVAIIITLLSSLFVVTNLGTSSFWHDEAFSGLLIRYDWPEMITRIQADVHPPLYYIMLRPWAAAWDGGAFSLRFFSYVFGVATAWAIYLLTKKIYRRHDIALIAAALFLTNSFVIQYLMEARMYTLGSFLLTLAAYIVLSAIEGTDEKRTAACLARWLGFGVLAGLALLTHYYAGIYLLALGLFGIIRLIQIGWNTRGGHVLQGCILSTVIAVFMFLPWMRAFLSQVTQVTTSYWIGGITPWSVPQTFFKMLTGVNGHSEIGVQQFAMLAVFALALWGTWISASRARMLAHDDAARNRALILPVLIIVPFVLSIILSIKTSIYLDRYFIYTLPFLLPALTAALTAVPHTRIRSVALTILIIGSAALFPWRWESLSIGEKPGMKTITTTLDERVQPNDRIIVGSSFALFTYRFHKTNALHELLYAPNPLLHYSGTALLADNDTIPSLDAIPQGTRVWSIDTTGFGNYQLPIPATWEKRSELISPDIYDFRGDIILREWMVR